MSTFDPIAYAAYVARVTAATEEANAETIEDVRAFGTRGVSSRRYAAITRTQAAEHTAALADLLAAGER